MGLESGNYTTECDGTLRWNQDVDQQADPNCWRGERIIIINLSAVQEFYV